MNYIFIKKLLSKRSDRNLLKGMHVSKHKFNLTIILCGFYREDSFFVTALMNTDVYFVCQYIILHVSR